MASVNTVNSPLSGEWEISAFEGSLRSRGMSIRYTVRVCDTGDQLVDHDDEDEDDISAYIDQIDPGPRGFRPRHRAALAQLCRRLSNSSSQSLNATSQSEEGERSLSEPTVASEGDIPKDVLQEVDRVGTEPGETAGGRRKRQAEAEVEESNRISTNTRKFSTAEAAYSEEMDEILSENHIQPEHERLRADVLEEANSTSLSLALALDYDDYSHEVPSHPPIQLHLLRSARAQ